MHGRYVTDIFTMCMNNHNAKKIILTNLQGFHLHIAGGILYLIKPCLQPISCLILGRYVTDIL